MVLSVNLGWRYTAVLDTAHITSSIEVAQFMSPLRSYSLELAAACT